MPPTLPKKKKKTTESPRQDELSFFGSAASQYKLLSREEEIELSLKTKGEGAEAQHAKDKFFLHNMRLVITLARGFYKSGLAVTDLVQEGSIGLMRAIEKFDPTRGFRFSTYASWWIRQAILRSIYLSAEIRIPVNVSSRKTSLNKLLRENPDLTEEEILEKTGFTKNFLHNIQILPMVDASLDDPISEERDTTVKDNLPDLDAVSADDELLYKEMSELIEEILEDTPKRDRDIFWEWIFGDSNFQEMGNKHGVSRERVRQITITLTKKVRARFYGVK